MPDKIKELCTPYCKVVAGYIVAASIWIFLGDWLIFALLPEKADMFYIGLLKGLGFIFFTALALHFLLRKNAELMFRAKLADTANTVLPQSFTKIFSSTPVIVYAVEAEPGRRPNTTWVSDNTEALLGFSQAQVLGTDWWPAHLHPDDRERVTAENRLLLQGGGGSYKYRVRTADGDYRYIKDELQLVDTTPTGKKLFIGVWTDLSDDFKAKQEVQAYATRTQQAMYNSIKVIAQLTELRDPYTAGHEARVGEVAAAIAAEMGYSEDFRRGMYIGGLLHDVGKVAIPSELLTKPAKPTPTEYELMKTHAEKGFQLLGNVEFIWPIAEVAHQHHERLDGSGYPRGLEGDEIITEARILAIADVIESMASHRPYRSNLGLDAALQEIDQNSGRLYDKNCAEACLRLFRDKGFHMPTVDRLDPSFLQAASPLTPFN